MVTTKNRATAISLVVRFVEDGLPFSYRRIGDRHFLDDNKPDEQMLQRWWSLHFRTRGAAKAGDENVPEILSDAATGANEV